MPGTFAATRSRFGRSPMYVPSARNSAKTREAVARHQPTTVASVSPPSPTLGVVGVVSPSKFDSISFGSDSVVVGPVSSTATFEHHFDEIGAHIDIGDPDVDSANVDNPKDNSMRLFFDDEAVLIS